MLTRMQSKIEPFIGTPIHRAHPLTRDLVGCWLLNEGAGGIAYDASGHHHDGVFSGAPAWSDSSFGHTVEFDGADDWIAMGDCLDVGTDDISVLALVNYSADLQPNGSNYGAIAGKGYLDGSSKGYGLYANPSNKIAWQLRNLSTVFTATSDDALNDGVWHLAIGVCDRNHSSGIRLYIDAVQQSTTVDATALDGVNLNGSSALAIGSRQAEGGTWYYDFIGRVAMVCVWKRVLLDTEIRRLQQNPFEMFAFRRPIAAMAPDVGGIVLCAGSIAAATAVSATMRVTRSVAGITGAAATVDATLSNTDLVSLSATVSVHATLHANLKVDSPEISSSIGTQSDRAWLSGALFNGVTHTAIVLGTSLTQGWFWVRSSGCTVVYRGSGLTQVDLGRILYVGEQDTHQILLPAYLPHAPGSTHHYLIRRFNGCGRQEATWDAAAVLRIASDGQRASQQPNAVHGLTSEPTSLTSVRLIWLYCPLDQEIPPAQFRVYSSDAAGEVDFSNPVAVVRYDGRRFYDLQCANQMDNTNIYVVQAADAAGIEGKASTIVTHRIEDPAPEPPVVLTAVSF